MTQATGNARRVRAHKNISAMARQLAERTSDAYSAGRFGTSWRPCAAVLLKRGYTVAEAETVLRSKWMRWAGDSAEHAGNPNSADLARFLDDPRNQCTIVNVRRMMAGTL